MPKIPSMKKILLIFSIVLVLSLIDFTAGSPYPSIGKGKTKRLGNFYFLKLYYSRFFFILSVHIYFFVTDGLQCIAKCKVLVWWSKTHFWIGIIYKLYFCSSVMIYWDFLILIDLKFFWRASFKFCFNAENPVPSLCSSHSI